MSAIEKKIKSAKKPALKAKAVSARAKTAGIKKKVALKKGASKSLAVKKLKSAVVKRVVVKKPRVQRVINKSLTTPAEPVIVRVVSEEKIKREFYAHFYSRFNSRNGKSWNLKRIFSRLVYNTALVLVPVLILIPMFQAFEAHIINTTAALAQIDPPVLTRPGDIGWDNPDGGYHNSDIDVAMSDVDSDATHIFYTYAAGTDPNILADPYCGGPNGGLKTDLQHLPLSQDTVVKAIACDNSTVGSHFSLINTKIYKFKQRELCRPVEINFPQNTALMAAGSDDSFDGIFASANVTVNGDVRGNHNLDANGGGPNRHINGNVTVSGTIESANFTITGASTTGAPSASLPTIDNNFWLDKANDGGVVSGSLIIPSNSGTIDLGPSEIMGNVHIGNNNTVNIYGTLYIHGNLVIDSNVSINQESAFGDTFAVVIVDGTIDISSNAAFNGSGSLGTFLLISNSGPQSGDNAAIETQSNNADLGDVVLFAKNGDVHINQNRTLLAIYAKEGTSSSNPAIDLDSNVTINFRTLPAFASCGPVFSPLNRLLINEFLPNPSGSDQGSLGGTLDGEFVEIYNGSSTPINLNGYVLYDGFLPSPVATSPVWTSNSDFASGTPTSNISIVSNSVVFGIGTGTGTFETILDVGEGNRADWQNLTWQESNTGSGNVCLQVAASNDGLNFSPFNSCDDITGTDLNSAGLPDSRYLKWKAVFTRSSASDSASLGSLTATYNLYNYHELVIKPENTDTGTTTIAAGGLLVVYREGDTDFELDNDGTDAVKLYSGNLWQGAELIDSRAYDYGGSVPDNKSFTRMPDGTSNWIDPDPSPGESNDEFIDPDISPSETIVFESEPSEEDQNGEVLGAVNENISGSGGEDIQPKDPALPVEPEPDVAPQTENNPEPATNSDSQIPAQTETAQEVPPVEEPATEQKPPDASVGQDQPAAEPSQESAPSEIKQNPPATEPQSPPAEAPQESAPAAN